MHFNMTRFKTLMWREWLQNRWTWLIAVSALPLLVLVSAPFGGVHVGNEKIEASRTALVVMPWAITALTCAFIAWLTTLFTASGLARRDTQDRSIEFWLSLPATQGEHFGAQYLMHALAFPLGALVLGLGLGLLVTLVVFVRLAGFGALGEVAWGAVLSGLAGTLPAAVLALVAAAVWLAPFVLALMAASAWLKRLGVPMLVIAAVALGNLSATRDWVRPIWSAYEHGLQSIVNGVVGVFVNAALPRALQVDGEQIQQLSLASYVGRLGELLVTPVFGLVVVLSAACVALLILRRRQAG